MREKTTNGQVIIVYTEHPVFGILLIPYIAERLEDGTLQLIAESTAVDMKCKADFGVMWMYVISMVGVQHFASGLFLIKR